MTQQEETLHPAQLSKKELANLFWEKRQDRMGSGDVSAADDIYLMHSFYEHHEPIENLTPELVSEWLNFRLDFIQEELTETRDAIAAKDGSEVVDGLIDLIVVAVGTLDLLQVDFEEAWERVLKANMTKESGINPTRPNKFGLPDLKKLPEFVAPDHSDNVGLLAGAFAQ